MGSRSVIVPWVLSVNKWSDSSRMSKLPLAARSPTGYFKGTALRGSIGWHGAWWPVSAISGQYGRETTAWPHREGAGTGWDWPAAVRRHLFDISCYIPGGVATRSLLSGIIIM